MNKTELIARIAEVSGLTKKDSETALNATLATIEDSTDNLITNTPSLKWLIEDDRPSKKKGKRRKNWE